VVKPTNSVAPLVYPGPSSRPHSKLVPTIHHAPFCTRVWYTPVGRSQLRFRDILKWNLQDFGISTTGWTITSKDQGGWQASLHRLYSPILNLFRPMGDQGGWKRLHQTPVVSIHSNGCYRTFSAIRLHACIWWLDQAWPVFCNCLASSVTELVQL